MILCDPQIIVNPHHVKAHDGTAFFSSMKAPTSVGPLHIPAFRFNQASRFLSFAFVMPDPV